MIIPIVRILDVFMPLYNAYLVPVLAFVVLIAIIKLISFICTCTWGIR